MRGLVEKRRQELLSSGSSEADILSLMIKSSLDDGKFTMDESELVRVSQIVPHGLLINSPY